MTQNNKSHGMSNKRKIGQISEQKATYWLKSHGFQILHQNWYHKHLEIDLVAENGRYRVFAEVKSGKNSNNLFPELKVNKSKQNFLMECADAYMLKYPTDKIARFDVISITYSNYSCQIYHCKDAFFRFKPAVKSKSLSHFCDTIINVT